MLPCNGMLQRPAIAAELDQLVRYFQEALGLTVTPSSWDAEPLPHYIRQLYSFHQVAMLGRNCLLMLDTDLAGRSPASVKKHIQVIGRHVDADIIYVPRKLTPYNRKRLVEQKVAFVAPGNQMYLPPLGIDLRERRRTPLPEAELFSPATQALVIHMLLRSRNAPLTSSEIVADLGYTKMTVTRALRELQATGLGEAYTIGTVGHQRFLQLSVEPRSFWNKVQPYLSSPVIKRVWIENSRSFPSGKEAGLTALAELTMLAPPERPTHAISRAEWIAYRADHHLIEIPADDPDACELEIWSYPPKQLSDSNLVDPLSLYLSLKDNNDERVEAALEELLEKIKW